MSAARASGGAAPLAAIQGLNVELEERLAEKDAEIDELRARVERLEALARAAVAKQATGRQRGCQPRAS